MRISDWSSDVCSSDLGELELVVRRAARLLDLGIAEDGAHEIARRARGTPRIAGRLLRRVRDFANVAGATVVDAKTADAALNRLEVDNLGLDAMDRRDRKSTRLNSSH